ncbi:MAG: hypothetical protein WBC51_13280 [Vicinamibacterales bacterium]
MTVTAARAAGRHLFDRRLFMIAAIAFPLIILAGFGRTYYLKGFFDVPPLASMLVHVHGVLMTTWVALFAAQVWLVSSKRIRVHQRLGYTGIGLAVLIIAAGFVTALRAAKFGAASTPPGVSTLGFLIVPLFDLLMFVSLFGGAIYYRKKPAAHKSLMLLTAVNFLPPAVARIPITSLQAFGPLWFFGFPTVLALLCLGLETWRYRRLNRVFLIGTLLLIASYIVRLMIMGTSTWMAIAGWLTSFV